MDQFLLIESGATKLEWVWATSDRILEQGILPGLHPFLSSQTDWQQGLSQLLKIVKETKDYPIYYYGTGCGQAQGVAIVRKQLSTYMPSAASLFVASDLLAAARALCGKEAGVIGILGTGSNTAWYNGQELVAGRGGFGYVLGDEGSGATIGRILLQAFLYQQLSPQLMQYLREDQQLDQGVIVSQLYQSDNPSRFLAQFARIAHDWLDKDEVLRLRVKENFRLLAKDCLQPLLQEGGLRSTHFVGSIAFHFQELLREALQAEGVVLGQCLQRPLPPLISYHQKET